jgi:hypothetical protein
MYYWLEHRPAERVDTPESPFPINAVSFKGQPLDVIYCGAGLETSLQTIHTKLQPHHTRPSCSSVSLLCTAGDARHFLNSLWHRQRSGINFQMRVILNDIHPMAMARLVVFFLQVCVTLLARCTVVACPTLLPSCATYQSTRPASKMSLT